MAKRALVMRTERVYQYLLLVLFLFALASCGANQKQAALGRAEANKCYDDGVAAVENRNFQVGLENLNRAINAGWLNPDRYVDAHVLRTVCNIGLGNVDAARSNLTELSEYPVDQGLLLSIKAFALKKQGHAAESQRMMRQAKALNPRVKSFD